MKKRKIPMLRLVIDDKIPFIREAAARLGQAVYLPGSRITAADVREADALIVRTRTRCDRALLEGSRVRFVATATIGYDHLDVSYLSRQGIRWANCPGCNARSVAQYVESTLLLLERDGALRLSDAPTLGLVGVGHVGTQVALMARRLGLRLLLCDPLRQTGHGGVREGEAAGGIADAECCHSLADVCRRADIISFHTPLTLSGPHATYHLADAAFFAALERRPIIINAARGEVVDTAALRAAMAAGRVSRAVIDTWENEPRIDRRLLAEAFLATPHIAGYSADGKACGTRMALTAVARHFGLDSDFSDILPPPVAPDFRYYPDAPDDAAATCPRLALYDPRRDTAALRARPEAFEELRGNYPLRRESGQ
jgi:erythronate-4-phosphate dehydrogenase